MDKLNLPAYKFRISGTQKNNTLIFDTFRKKFISLSPEEWVRQHILRFLTEEKSVPEALVSVEAGININRLAKRYDALIFDRNGKPWMIVECKAPSVAINQSVFDQVVAYNQTVKAKYILVTNGLKHYCCDMSNANQQVQFLSNIPNFND